VKDIQCRKEWEGDSHELYIDEDLELNYRGLFEGTTSNNV